MAASTRECPCCGGTAFSALVSFPDVPLSGHFRTRPSDAVPTIDLDHELCEQCGLVRQTHFARPPDYREADRSTARQLPAYVGSLIRALLERGAKRNAFLLEVGCNDGTFMLALRDAGFDHLLGVEPSVELAKAAAARGFRVDNDYFGPERAALIVAEHGHPMVVTCRHTLEHVPDPLAFMRALRHCFTRSDGLLLIEVPDGSAIPELTNVYELWDEHLYCFARENLAMLSARAGFEVESIETVPHLDTRNLVVSCRPAAAPAGAIRDPTAASAAVRLWRDFRSRWPRYRDAVAGAVRAAPKPVYFVGASHVQSNYANYIRVGGEVAFMVDDDPLKIGKVPPVKDGAPAIIPTTSFLSAATAGTIVRTAFGYPGWMDRLCEHARSRGMTVIDPRKFLPPT